MKNFIPGALIKVISGISSFVTSNKKHWWILEEGKAQLKQEDVARHCRAHLVASTVRLAMGDDDGISSCFTSSLIVSYCFSERIKNVKCFLKMKCNQSQLAVFWFAILTIEFSHQVMFNTLSTELLEKQKKKNSLKFINVSLIITLTRYFQAYSSQIHLDY